MHLWCAITKFLPSFCLIVDFVLPAFRLAPFLILFCLRSFYDVCIDGFRTLDFFRGDRFSSVNVNVSLDGRVSSASPTRPRALLGGKGRERS